MCRVDAELGFVDGAFLAYPVGVVGFSGVLTRRHHEPTPCSGAGPLGTTISSVVVTICGKNNSPPGLVVWVRPVGEVH